MQFPSEDDLGLHNQIQHLQAGSVDGAAVPGASMGSRGAEDPLGNFCKYGVLGK